MGTVTIRNRLGLLSRMVAKNFLYEIFSPPSIYFSPAIVNRLLQNRALNISKAVQSLKYGVTPFEEGISRTIQHLQTDRNV